MTTSNIINIYEYSDYRSYLSAILNSIKTRNNNYSLRSLSKHLQLTDPGVLSRVLNNQRNLTVDQAHLIAKNLKLKNREIEYFILMAIKDFCRNQESLNFYKETSENYRIKEILDQ